MFNLKISLNNINNNNNNNINTSLNKELILNEELILKSIKSKIENENEDILNLAEKIYLKLEKKEEISTDIFNELTNSGSTNSGSTNSESTNSGSNSNSNENLNKSKKINNYISNQRLLINSKKIKTITREPVRSKQYIFYEIYKKNNKYIKLYRFNHYEDYVNFILEVTFQIYTYYNIQKCKTKIEFTTPKIFKCYKTCLIDKLKHLEHTGAKSYKYFFYIEMEEADGETLGTISSTIKGLSCKLLSRIIKNIDKCLKKQKIYHNDLNKDNIFIKKGDYGIEKITIIDFGLTLDKPLTNARAQKNYVCNKNKGIIYLRKEAYEEIEKIEENK